ncbi:MAG: DUF6586 family protein [Cellvibrio sp.]
MSASHLVRVNRALRAAELLLNDLIAVSPKMRCVLVESGILQLDLALNLYARELAQNLGLPNISGIESMEHLAKRMAAAHKCSQEVEELLRLMSGGSLALNNLKLTIFALKSSSETDRFQKSLVPVEPTVDAGLIPVHLVDGEIRKEPDFDVILIRKAVEELKEIIFRQRMTTNEF